MSSPEPKTQSTLAIYFRLLTYVRPYVGLFILSIVGFLIFASTQPMLAYILKYFVDGLANPEASLFPGNPYLGKLQLLETVPLMIVLIAAWQGVGSFLGNFFLAPGFPGAGPRLARGAVQQAVGVAQPLL